MNQQNGRVEESFEVNFQICKTIQSEKTMYDCSKKKKKKAEESLSNLEENTNITIIISTLCRLWYISSSLEIYFNHIVCVQMGNLKTEDLLLLNDYTFVNI